MSSQGIKITDLRPEIQTLVNSDPTKYNPNRNEFIDEGDELSQLLSEYQCTKEDLTKKGGKTMLTSEEKKAVDAYVKGHTDANYLVYGIGGLATLGASVGALQGIGGGVDNGFLENKKSTKLVDVETLVKDGSYTKKGRPAYDIGKYMKQYISEADANKIPGSRTFANGVDLARCTGPMGYCTGTSMARDIDGKPFVLRKWQKGDPQFVKTGTKSVEVIRKALTNNARFGVFMTMLTAALGFGTYAVAKSVNDSAADDKITEIKAKQAEIGQQIMEQRRKEAAERAEREAALKQEELEYRERMNAAVSGVESKVSSADRKAKSVNRELDKIQKKTKAEEAEAEV